MQEPTPQPSPEEPRYTEVAARAAAFVLESLRKEGRLLRSYMEGSARHNAYLDDYACLIDGLVERVKSEYGQALTVIATGGVASLFEGASKTINHYDQS